MWKKTTKKIHMASGVHCTGAQCDVTPLMCAMPLPLSKTVTGSWFHSVVMALCEIYRLDGHISCNEPVRMATYHKFLPRELCSSAVLGVVILSVYPSVRLSHACISAFSPLCETSRHPGNRKYGEDRATATGNKYWCIENYLKSGQCVFQICGQIDMQSDTKIAVTSHSSRSRSDKLCVSLRKICWNM